MAERDGSEEIQPENAVSRVARLPFIQSAFQILSFAYQDVKTLHPVVGYFCSVSERGVKVASRVAAIGVSPVLRTMEPQIAVANSAALRVVAELEKRLPVLDQPADEVASDLRDGLVGRVRAWRDQAVGGVQGVLGRAQAAVKETRKAVSLSAITLASLGFGQTVSRGAELAISQAEELVNRYLPEEEEGGYESCGSDGSEEAGGAEPGLFSRARSLVITVVRRSLGRLHPYLDGAWGLLNGGILLLRSLPDELWRRFQRVRRALLLEDVTKEVPKPSATPMKIKIGSLSRSVRTHSLSKRRLYLETKTSSYNHRMPTFLVSGSGNRILPEQGDESVRIRYNRRQSLDSFF